MFELILSIWRGNPLNYCINHNKWTERIPISLMTYWNLLCVILISTQQNWSHFSHAEQDSQIEVRIHSSYAAKLRMQVYTMCTESIVYIRLKQMGMKMWSILFSFKNKITFLSLCGLFKTLGNKVPSAYLFLGSHKAMQSSIYNCVKQIIQSILECFCFNFYLLKLCN